MRHRTCRRNSVSVGRRYAALPDGSSYRRWSGLFEFLVTPDARCIHARTLDQTNEEALLAYLLVDALSFSMVRLGREPLHATAVLTPHGVVAFVGESGDGKSTLGALLVRHGFRLVTDDMLVLTVDGDECVAHAGPPRIKLYRHIADRIFDAGYSGVPMNPVTEKLIIPLNHDQSVHGPHPLRAIYLIHAHHHGGAVRARVFGSCHRPWLFRRFSPRPQATTRSSANVLPVSSISSHACSRRFRSRRSRIRATRTAWRPCATPCWPTSTEW